MKIGIIVSQFNKEISDRLLEGAVQALGEAGLKKDQYDVFEVPGAFEIPLMCQKLTDQKIYDGFIALGCVLKGETDHYKAVCEGVTYGIQKVSIEQRIPILFGVLMCKTMEQAMVRSENTKENKGYECTKGLIILLQNR